ncbi:MAG: IS630 family transposase [Candidatus Endonucleobacter sp. (ex Gigantidas childressi)]|nr:IS630 family transposase [Candidatus Endonucleobacter sp. (ex Gigantidas childressi)]
MSKFTLTQQQKIDLESRHKILRDVREYDRIKEILLWPEGWSINFIAQALRKNEFTISRHIKNYINKEKLKPENGGSDSHLDDEQTQQLIKHVSEKTYAHTHQIVAYIAECWKIQYSVSGMNRWLHQKGFTYKQPKGTPYKTDADKQAKFVKRYAELKASLPKNEVVLFMDAVHPTPATKITSGWIRKGVDKVINTTDSRTRLNIIGPIELTNLSAAVFEQFETVNGKAIIQFFKKIRPSYISMVVIHMVLGAGYHHSKEVVEEAEKQGIKLHYLPPYIPAAFQVATLLAAFAHPDHLLLVGSRGFAYLLPSSNLKCFGYIERLWKVINEHARNNEYFAKPTEFQQKINHFLDDTLPKIGASLVSRINDNFQRLNSAS